MKKLLALLALIPAVTFGQGAARRIDTLTELLAINPTAFATAGKLSYEVGGYRTNGDWGSSRLITWDATSTATTNLGCVWAAGPGGTNGQWVAKDCETGELPATWFGANGHDDLDDSDAIQAALDYGEHRTVKLSNGVFYQNKTINLEQNRHLRGDNTTYTEAFSTNPASPQYLKGASTWLRLLPNANCVQLHISTNGATYIRSLEQPFYDGSLRTQFFVNSSVADIGFHGNVANQTLWSSHAITANEAWNWSVENVTIISPAGYGIQARNCNCFRISRCNIVGSPYRSRGILIDDCADVTIDNCFLFGADGPLLWMNSYGGWKNQIYGNLIGNSYHETLKAVTVAGTNFTAIGHEYATGDMLQFQTTGTLPDQLSSNKVFMAVVHSTNTFGIATNWANCEAGITTEITGGSGDLSVFRGRPSGIYFSTGAGRSSIVATRVDQCFSHGIWLENANRVSITGNELSENGNYGVPAATTNFTAAVYINGDSDNNTIVGNVGTGNDCGIWVADELSRGNSSVGNSFSGPELFGTTTALAANRFIGIGNTVGSTRFTGGVDGNSVIELYRPDRTNVIGLRPSTGSFNIYDETAAKTIGSLANDEFAVVLNLGGALETPARDSYFQFPSATAETNTVGDVQFRGPRGVGTNALSGEFYFFTADTNSIGVLQTNTPKVIIDRSYGLYETPIKVLLNGAMTRVLSSVGGVLNVGLSSGSHQFYRGDGVFSHTLMGDMVLSNAAPVLLINDANGSSGLRLNIQNGSSAPFRIQTNGTTIFTFGPAGTIVSTQGTFWNSGNDGSGSTLDADLLDGNHASAFLTDAPSDGTTYGRNNATWTAVTSGLSDAPSTGSVYGRSNATWAVVSSGTSYSFTNGLTNSAGVVSWAALPGGNVSFTTNNGQITISSSTGTTNSGTAVSVDGAATMVAANFADSPELNPTASGSNVTYAIVTGSIATNKIDATFHGLLTAADLVGSGTNIFVNSALVSLANLQNDTGAGGINWAVSGSNIKAYATNVAHGLTFTNGLTNAAGVVSWAAAPGGNISFTTNNGLITIAATTVGTNSGTAVSVDGAASLAIANLADSTELNPTASGSNITYAIVTGSIATNKIDSTFHGLLTSLNNLTYTNGLTNSSSVIQWAAAPGANVTFTTNNGKITIAASTGSTNDLYIAKNVTKVSISNTVDETTVYAWTIPADTLNANGDELEFYVPAKYLEYNGQTNGYRWDFYIDRSQPGESATTGNYANALASISTSFMMDWNVRVKRMSSTEALLIAKHICGADGSGDTTNVITTSRYLEHTIVNGWDQDMDFELTFTPGITNANHGIVAYGSTVRKLR